MRPPRPPALGGGLAALLVGIYALQAALVVRAGGNLERAWLGPRTGRVRTALGGRVTDRLGEEPWRLLSSALVHVDLAHLAVNAAAAAALGWLGRREPPARWLAALAAGHLGGALLSVVSGPARSDGASAALLGVLGLLLTSRHPQRSLLAGAAVLDLLTAAAVPRVDLPAHVGGLLGGVALGGAWAAARQASAPPRR